MPRSLRYFLAGLAVLLACMPIAFLITMLLIPLWSWIEATYGIESKDTPGLPTGAFIWFTAS